MSFIKRPIHHINLTVPNLEKAVDFYTKTLNFDITDKFKSPTGMEFIFISDGTTTYELIENSQVSSAVVDHIAYCSDDIQADYKYFLENTPELLLGEVNFINFLFEKGVYFFFIKGVTGERIEYCQKA